MRWTDGEGRYQASNKIWKPKGNEGKWQRKGNMAVLHTVKKLPDWNNHPGVFCSMMSMCFCLGFKALCEGKSAATPCKLFFSPSFQPLCDLWSGQATGSHPTPHPCPSQWQPSRFLCKILIYYYQRQDQSSFTTTFPQDKILWVKA